MAGGFVTLFILVLLIGGIATVAAWMEVSGRAALGVLALTVLLSCLLWATYLGLASIHRSDGHRDGYVQKFSTAGVFWRTREGQLGLNQQGFNEWHFSCADPAVAAELEKLDTRKLVRLHYQENLGPLPWRGETQYFVTKVEPLEDKPDLR